MTYQEALDQILLAMATLKKPGNPEMNFERVILAILIELELLKIESSDEVRRCKAVK